jgi:alkylation response protein AidB-like acyl-CoA dehydrogenase
MHGTLVSATQSDVGGLIASARRLKPEIDAVREELDERRRLPPALVEAMRAAGMFNLWLPRTLGGPALNVIEFVKVIEELARFDGSVGWCATNGAGYSRLAGYLAPSVAAEIFDGGRSVLAGTLNPTGKAVVVDGGYRVTGRWAYGSGIEHSTWTIGNCIVHDGDAPRLEANGAPEVRLMIFPTSAVEIIDTWHVGGLRGTGSHDYRVADLYVAQHHSFPGFTPAPTVPGTLYALPTTTVLGVSIAAVPLGIARAAIDALVELAQSKRPMGSAVLLRDKPAVQADIGRAESLLRSARAFLFEAVQELWDEVEGGAPASMRRRALVRLANTQAVTASAQVVDLMYSAGGGTSIYEGNRLERCFRDVHAATQHIAVATSNYEIAGRVLLGLDPGTLRF